MEIKNTANKIIIGEVLPNKEYKVNINCDGEFRFSFLLRDGDKIRVLGTEITNKKNISSFKFISSFGRQQQLILSNDMRYNWTTATIELEERYI